LTDPFATFRPKDTRKRSMLRNDTTHQMKNLDGP
jgi:hypothetical protein